MLLPRIDKRIDDLQYENYNVPVLMYGERKLIIRDRYHDMSGGAYQHVEADFEDARIEKEYDLHEHTFREIQDVSELNKLSKLNDLLEKMLHHKNVSNIQLRTLLSEQEYTDYITSLEIMKHPSEIMYGDGMPSELRDYISYVRRADFQSNKYENMYEQKKYGKANYSSQTVVNANYKAEGLYESALERLGEIWGIASPAEKYEIQNWMDREIDLDEGAKTMLSTDCNGIPRVRGSKSKNALDSGLPKLSKRLKRKECQLQALRSAACAIAFEAEVVEEVAVSSSVLNNKLQDLLKLRDDY